MNPKLLILILVCLQGALSYGENQLTANSSCTEDCCKSLIPRQSQTYYFYQKTGRFRGGQGQWAVDVHGYSGQGDGYLNPDLQCVKNTGPLPVNKYLLSYCQNIMHQTVPRPCSFVLTPTDESKMCGRDDFMVHGCDCCTPGDSTVPPSAGCSAGCVVINYENRLKLRVGDYLIVEHTEPSLLAQE